MFLQGRYGEAAGHLRACLQAVGRPLPTSKLELAVSLVWNVVRQALQWACVGRRLTRFVGLWHGLRKQEAKDSARDAALVYHKLNQLYLTGA